MVTGGARSGKSRFAEAYAMRLGEKGLYIATSQIYDEEMRQRVDRHRARREGAAVSARAHEPLRIDNIGQHSDPVRAIQPPFAWTTVEEPYELAAVLSEHADSIILVDCLTLWLTNWLLRYESEDDAESKVMAKVDELSQVLSQLPNHVIVVTNEVGDGIVPEYPLGRLFRDLAGWMNQRIASVCREVFLVTAGIPVELKRLAYRFSDADARGSEDGGQR